MIVNTREVVVNGTAGSRSYGEILKANGGVWNMHTNSLHNKDSFMKVQPSYADDDNVGSFFMELDLENLFANENTLSGLEVYNSLQFYIKKTGIAEQIDTLFTRGF